MRRHIRETAHPRIFYSDVIMRLRAHDWRGLSVKGLILAPSIFSGDKNPRKAGRDG